jgi:N-acetylglucosamine kinase-like BadF-type ATPase
MIIVADSGSTKTDWRLIKGDLSTESFETKGINPYYQSKEEITGFMRQEVLPYIDEKVREIYFYGAGCTAVKEDFVAKAFSDVIAADRIEVKSDLWAAARALCFDQPGIACILGTGSNSCYYDGKNITENIPPLGYVLGDEGSAAVLGKRLVADYLKKVMPETLRVVFEKDYSITTAEVLNRIYRSEFPNRYLAGFAPFLSKNISHPWCQKLVSTEFLEFIRRNVLNYKQCRSVPVNFAGSVAYYFETQLRTVLADNRLMLGKIEKQPIDLLTAYHRRHRSKEEI